MADADLCYFGGTAGVPAYFRVDSAGIIYSSDGTTTVSWTPGGAISLVNLTVTGNTVIGNLATADTIDVSGARFISDLVPSTNNARALGTTALRWGAAWFDGLVTSGGGFSGVIGATGPAAGTFTDLTAGGNTILGDAGTDTITPNGRLAADLLPSTNAARSLGSTALRYLDGWFTGTLYNTLQDWTAATGVAKAIVGANLAIAWRIADSVGDFLTIQSTTAARFLKFARPWMDAAPTAVTMAGAAHALVWGTAGAAQTSVTSRIITVTAGAGVPTLTPPDVTVGDGVELTILNASSTTFIVLSGSGLGTSNRIYQNGSVTLISAAGFWLVKNQTGHLKSGLATVLAGQTSIAVAVGADWDGKPATATVYQAAADAVFVSVLRTFITGGNLTIYGLTATADTVVAYHINGA